MELVKMLSKFVGVISGKAIRGVILAGVLCGIYNHILSLFIDLPTLPNFTILWLICWGICVLANKQKIVETKS